MSHLLVTDDCMTVSVPKNKFSAGGIDFRSYSMTARLNRISTRYLRKIKWEIRSKIE